MPAKKSNRPNSDRFTSAVEVILERFVLAAGGTNFRFIVGPGESSDVHPPLFVIWNQICCTTRARLLNTFSNHDFLISSNGLLGWPNLCGFPPPSITSLSH